MYIESKPGDLGFAERQMGLSQSSDVQIMGPAAPPAAMPTPTTAMHPVSSGKMPYVVGGVMLVGLGFVIWKATR
jgi:hypothetical protein